MLNDNQQEILKEFLKNILNSSADWEREDMGASLDFASINEQASICYQIVKFGDYEVGHPYDPIQTIDECCGRPKGSFKKFVKENPVL
jgi:hypothetical protein